MKKVVLIKYGEIALRGKNRYLYENRLIKAIYKNIGYNIGYSVIKEQGRLIVEKTDGSDIDFISDKIEPVLGVVGYSLCLKTTDQSLENLQKIALDYVKEEMGDRPFSLRVITKRAIKKYPHDSNYVSAAVGGYIFNALENCTVNLTNPDFTLHIELRTDAYIYANPKNTFGGLPVGCSGKGMLLLSGGLDSPVAGFMMAKRGVFVEAVYFHSPPFTSEAALEKVIDLSKRLSVFTGEIKLHVVKFTEIQKYLYEKVPLEKLTIFLKRAMLTVADKIATENNCRCLITGDSVGQVASQTIEALEAVNSAAKLPIIRPLSGMDKSEIVNLSKKIETFDISIRPFPDCCTVFVAKHPETRPKTSVIEKMEEKLEDMKKMIEECEIEIYNF